MNQDDSNKSYKKVGIFLVLLFYCTTISCNSDEKTAFDTTDKTIRKSLDACTVLVLEDAIQAFNEPMQQKEGYPRNFELHEGKVLISSCSYSSQSSKQYLSLNITYNTLSKYPKTVEEFVENYSKEMGESKEENMKIAKSIAGVGVLNILLAGLNYTIFVVYLNEYELYFSTDKNNMTSDQFEILANSAIAKL